MSAHHFNRLAPKPLPPISLHAAPALVLGLKSGEEKCQPARIGDRIRRSTTLEQFVVTHVDADGRERPVYVARSISDGREVVLFDREIFVHRFDTVSA